MTTYEFKDLTGLPVVSNAAAREIGTVKEVLFNPAANALYGFVVTPTEKDGPPLLIPLNAPERCVPEEAEEAGRCAAEGRWLALEERLG